MSEKKMVRRSVAFALGIICIILVAGLAETLIVLNSANSQITSLQGQVSDFNKIANFEKVEIWLSNKTFTMNPNQNFTEYFNASLSSSVEVEGYVEPPNPNIWVNFKWRVYYNPSLPYIYQVYPDPYIVNRGPSYFDLKFPIVSFGPTYLPESYVGITIGNSNPTLTSVVNLTIALTY
jgi:hypothetical protein